MKKQLILAFIFISLFQFSFIHKKTNFLPTSMRITVINRLGSPVENAKVTVYGNQEDYENEENAVAGPAFTDEKGRVTFKNLESKSYYVQVIKDDANNYGDAEQTGELVQGKLNKFNIVIM